MDKKERNNQEYYTVDLLHIVKTLWRQAWIIALSGLLTAAMGFAFSAFVITPTYSSSIKLYVNNTSFSLGNTSFSISASELTAAQSLVRTYGEILGSRSTLERIIDKADVDYTYKDLQDMIDYAPSNDTEIMRVTVTTTDPYEASKIANTIAEVLPIRIAEIIDGASMEVVDSAIPELDKVAPSITKYTAIGMILGIMMSAMFLAVIAVMDDTIHDEDYILNNYEYPILGKVPDLNDSGKEKYTSYYSLGNKKDDVEKER
jgi:capsular polysaccharide biosynthesis protein